MPASTSWTDLQAVQAWEERLRLDQVAFTPDAVDLDPYWVQMIGLFEVHRQITHYPDKPITAGALALLRPSHRWLVAHRWPGRMPAGGTP